MAMYKYNTKDVISKTRLNNNSYDLFKGTIGSEDTITLADNVADTFLLQPNVDPAGTTKIFRIKNQAGVEQFSITANGTLSAFAFGSPTFTGVVTLTDNVAGTLILQPTSDPAGSTQLVQIKNAAGTVQLSLQANGGATFGTAGVAAGITQYNSTTWYDRLTPYTDNFAIYDASAVLKIDNNISTLTVAAFYKSAGVYFGGLGTDPGAGNVTIAHGLTISGSGVDNFTFKGSSLLVYDRVTPFTAYTDVHFASGIFSINPNSGATTAATFFNSGGVYLGGAGSDPGATNVQISGKLLVTTVETGSATALIVGTNSAEQFRLLSGANTMQWLSGTAALITVASANLTVSTTTSGTLALTSAGAVNVTSVAASTWAGSGGTLTLQSTSAALTVQTLTSGTLTVQSAGVLVVGANAAEYFRLLSNANTMQWLKEVNALISVANTTTSNTAGANIQLQAGSGVGTGSGGAATVQAGTGGNSGAGGAGGLATVSGGPAVTGNNQGGGVTLSAGNGAGDGAGGLISILGGTSVGGNGNGGRIQLQPGAKSGTGLKPLVELDGSGAVPTTAVMTSGFIGFKYNTGSGTLVAYVNDGGTIRSLSLGSPA